MKYIICLILILVWLHILHIQKCSSLHFWYFLTGSLGLFVFLMVLVRPILVQPLSRCVAAIAGIFGSLTGTFTAFFKYGILFIDSASGAITLQIDFECSGIIEIIAFLSLLLFFEVYTTQEKIVISILGTLGIIAANVLRIIVICELMYFFGMDAYYISHALVGRFVFYALSVLLYFYVFTKPQIVRIQVGKFSYGNNK